MAFTYLERAHLNLFAKLERVVADRKTGRGGVPFLSPEPWLKLLSPKMEIFDSATVLNIERNIFELTDQIYVSNPSLRLKDCHLSRRIEEQIFQNASRLVLYPDREARSRQKINRGYGVVDGNEMHAQRSRLIMEISNLLLEFLIVKVVVSRTDSLVDDRE